MQLATLEAAITFLQQQTPQNPSTPQPGFDVPDDTDDAAPTPGLPHVCCTCELVQRLYPTAASVYHLCTGKSSGLERQNTGQRRLLAALDSEAPLSFAQTTPSRYQTANRTADEWCLLRTYVWHACGLVSANVILLQGSPQVCLCHKNI